MQHLHASLMQQGHAKHFARIQYGLFLKGIGLDVHESLVFWKNAFTKLTSDQFQKSYAYNIRYNYGLEGKKTDYSPLSCIKIITSNQPGPLEVHGCPFRHFGQEQLQRYLDKSGEDMTQVLEYTKQGHYQIACTKYLETTTKTTVETIQHPNQYFDQAYKCKQVE
jgi:DNA primase large subunit